MASNIPMSLKSADVSRFVVRAAQVEKVKPAASYWCYYYVLEKILNQGLHNTDEQCKAYVISLMDKVEQMKTEYPEDDAIKDEMAAKAYMEQFGTETFLRADNAVRANKASKNTADAFSAAYTFLDVLHVWGQPEQEITEKIKYAKYHAVRILKAIKAGEDPNDSNPQPEPEEAEIAAPLDANDPEVQAITGLGPSPAAQVPGSDVIADSGLPQFVDHAPVSHAEGQIQYNDSASKPTEANLPGNVDEDYYQTTSNANGSPHPDTAGSGYFPNIAQTQAEPAPVLPGPPSNPPGFSGSPALPSAPPIAPYNQDFQQTSPQLPGPPAGPVARAAFSPPPASVQPFRPAPSQPPPAAAPPIEPPIQVASTVDDEAMARAQKHARFAISALNFEDVNTAVKELRAALADLGQR